MVEEISNESRMLRTLVRGDVYERLEYYAKTLSNGMGKWDFGVAIERLLDYTEFDERLKECESRLQALEVASLEVDVKSATNEEKSSTQFLGKKNKDKYKEELVENGKD